MMSILRKLRSLFHRSVPAAKTVAGLYHYRCAMAGGAARFHLRIDATGSGILLANARAGTHLNARQVVIAQGLLEGVDERALAARVRMQEAVASVPADAEIAAVRQLLEHLLAAGEGCPLLCLMDAPPDAAATVAERPLSADVPLCAPPEMKPLLDRLWEVGIPHVTFLVDHDSDDAALVRAVERAEHVGFITAVRGRGSDLVRDNRINRLANAGLAQVNVSCLTLQDEIHDALVGAGDHQLAVQAVSAARKNRLCPVAEIALVASTRQTVGDTLRAIAAHGVRDVGIFAVAATDAAAAVLGALAVEELAATAQQVEQTAKCAGVRLRWYPPVRFDPRQTLSVQVCRGPRCSGDAAIRVEADGAVIPPRGPYASAGNVLHDDWETIAHSAVYQAYWRCVTHPAPRANCAQLAACAVDCVRDAAGWAEAAS